MTALAIIASVIGLGFLCWCLVDLVVYALPAIVGIAVGVAAYHTGAGVLGGVVVALIAASVTLGLGQFAIETSRSPAVRRTVGFLFVLPAAWFGYGIALNLMQLGGASSVVWQQVLALAAGVMGGAMAWARVSGIDPA